MIYPACPQSDQPAEPRARCAVVERTGRRWRALTFGLVIILNCGYLHLGAQQPDSSRAKKVKVAYLYNFTRYVNWPATAFENDASPFVIGVLGNDPLGPSLSALQKRKAAGRRIVILRFDSIADYQPSHILFVPHHTPADQRAELLRRTQGTPLLIVGESPHYATDGAGLNFYYDSDDTVGFELNVDAIKRGGIRVDAKLLSIARVVRDKGL